MRNGGETTGEFIFLSLLPRFHFLQNLFCRVYLPVLIACCPREILSMTYNRYITSSIGALSGSDDNTRIASSFKDSNFSLHEYTINCIMTITYGKRAFVYWGADFSRRDARLPKYTSYGGQAEGKTRKGMEYSSFL